MVFFASSSPLRVETPLDVTRPPTGADDAALRTALVFVDRLAEWPLHTWIAVGREVAALPSDPLYTRAWTELRTTIRELGLSFAEWRLRDALDTAEFAAVSGHPRLGRADRRHLAATREAAEAAALSLLVRDRLSPVVAARFMKPFDDILELSDAD